MILKKKMYQLDVPAHTDILVYLASLFNIKASPVRCIKEALK